MMWLMVSMYLVLLAKKEKHATTFNSAFSGLSLIQMGFLFVDDTDLIIMGNKEEKIESVIQRMQQAITFWNGILRVSGDALKPEKCYWYLANFKWENGECKLIENTPEQILIEMEDENRIPIAYEKPKEATEAVGVRQDLNGTCTKQLEEIINKIKKYIQR